MFPSSRIHPITRSPHSVWGSAYSNVIWSLVNVFSTPSVIWSRCWSSSPPRLVFRWRTTAATASVPLPMPLVSCPRTAMNIGCSSFNARRTFSVVVVYSFSSLCRVSSNPLPPSNRSIISPVCTVCCLQLRSARMYAWRIGRRKNREVCATKSFVWHGMSLCWVKPCIC